jgi:hypothetical protein
MHITSQIEATYSDSFIQKLSVNAIPSISHMADKDKTPYRLCPQVASKLMRKMNKGK